MAGSIIFQGLLRWGATTVVPVRDVQFSPAIVTLADASAGDGAPTGQSILGANPAFTASMPAGVAIDLFTATNGAETSGVLSLLKVDPTTGQPAAGAANVLLSLQAGAYLYGQIESISVQQYGHAQAQVSFFLISSDGNSHPLAKSDGAALSLAADPVLNTNGPVTINGTEIEGSQGFSVSFSHDMTIETSSGDKYPTAYGHHMTATTIDINHGDPDAVLDELGLTGVSIASATSVALYDVTNEVVAATGRSITATGGIAVPRQTGGGVQGRATSGITIATTGLPTFGTF